MKFTRVQTLGDGSCWFHSILTLTSLPYRTSTQSVKAKYAQILRATLADKISLQHWDRYGLIVVQEEVVKTLPQQSKILDKLFDGSSTISECIRKCSDESIINTINTVSERLYKYYIQLLRNTAVWMDWTLISLIIDFLPYNIKYFYTYKGDIQEYKTLSYTNNAYKTLYIYWVKPVHFEALVEN